MRYLKGRAYFPVVVGVHLVLWALDLLRHQGPLILAEGESVYARVGGEIASSWVVTVFGFNLLMATRAHWLERLFGGLDKMYLIHRRSGTIALFLLIAHFALVPRHPEFSPGKPMGFAAFVLIIVGIIVAAAPPLKKKIPYDKWLKSHRILGLVYMIGVCHALFVPTLTSQLPLVRTYVLLVALVGIGSWLYKAAVQKRMQPSYDYAVSGVTRHGANTVELSLEPKAAALPLLPGQFGFFTFPGLAAGEAHPFTVASPSGTPLRLVIKEAGDFTARLVEQSKEGDPVRVEGPYGHLTQAHAPEVSQLWVAGGIGITPFLAMARQLVNEPGERRARLVWTVRSRADAHFDAELQELAAQSDALDYELWCSDEKGHLSLSDVSVDPKSLAVAFLCGPTPLRSAMSKQLVAAGLDEAHILTEEFAFR